MQNIAKYNFIGGDYCTYVWSGYKMCKISQSILLKVVMIVSMCGYRNCKISQSIPLKVVIIVSMCGVVLKNVQNIAKYTFKRGDYCEYVWSGYKNVQNIAKYTFVDGDYCKYVWGGFEECVKYRQVYFYRWWLL